MSNQIGDLLPQLAVTVIVLGIAATALGKWHDQRVMAAIPQPTREEPHVLLLLVDGLQAADFRWVHNDAHSPKHLARLAAEGRLLPRIMSDHATLSESLPALMSGNARSTDPIDPSGPLSFASEVTPAGRLSRTMPRTIGLPRDTALTRSMVVFSTPPTVWAKPGFGGFPRATFHVLQGLETWSSRAAADLNHASDRLVGRPRRPPGIGVRAVFGLADFDDQLGKLLDSLRMYELEDQTMIVVVGSNGESLPTLIWYPEHVTSTSTMGIEPDDLRNIDQIGPTILHLVNRSAGQETAAP